MQRSVNIIPWRLRGVVRRLPVIASLQRELVSRLLAGRTFVHTVNAGPARGLRYPVALPTDKGIWTGMYESAFAAALAAAVSPGDVCFDIGGYRGFMAGVLAVSGASSVVVFEPLPENRRQLERVSAANPHLPIRVEPFALGAGDGEAEFQVMADASMGKLSGSTFQPDVTPERSFPVTVRSLDGLVRAGVVPRPDVIKIDVEGSEADVLRGATEVLGEVRPRVFIEAHTAALARECGELLAERGYQLTVLETRHPPGPGLVLPVCHLAAWPRAR